MDLYPKATLKVNAYEAITAASICVEAFDSLLVAHRVLALSCAFISVIYCIGIKWNTLNGG